MTLDAKPKTDAHIVVDGDYISSASANYLPVKLFCGNQLTSTAVSLSASGSAVLIASAGTTNRIYVYQGFIAATTANIATFQNGATAVTGPIGIAANGQISMPYTGEPWFVTAAGASFRVTLDASATFAGILHYKVGV